MFSYTDNNERTRFENGKVVKEYDGMPAQGVVEYEIEDFEVEHYDGEQVDEVVLEEVVEDYIKPTLFDEDTSYQMWIDMWQERQWEFVFEDAEDRWLVTITPGNKNRVS